MNPKEFKWHERFMYLAKEVSTWSKDPSTQVGCVLVKNRRVISTGFNGFPRGLSDDLDRLTNRKIKYEMTVHAEVNAVTTAALHGVSTDGCDAYVTFQPCSRCAAVLINAGICSVYVAAKKIPDRWLDNFILASKMLEEAGIPLQNLSLQTK
jgi:dCMP deaminase